MDVVLKDRFSKELENYDGNGEKEPSTKSVDVVAQEEDLESPPLSPIVGYQFHTDDENIISESSDTDSETTEGLCQRDENLDKSLHQKSTLLEPDTPRSAMRRRIRKRRYKQMQEESKENENGVSKKLKFHEEVSQEEVSLKAEDDNPSSGFESAKVIEEEQSSPPMPMPIPEGACRGFRTASGKEVKISEAAMRKAKQLWDAPDPDPIIIPSEDTADENMTLVGFKTASGKAVKISEAALKQAIARDQEAEAIIAAKNGPSIARKSLGSSSSTSRISSPGMGFVRPMTSTKKFKPPTRIVPVAASTSTGTNGGVSSTPTRNLASTLSTSINLENDESGLAQEVQDCIQAFLDDDEEGFS